jgi:hypothetical protein
MGRLLATRRHGVASIVRVEPNHGADWKFESGEKRSKAIFVAAKPSYGHSPDHAFPPINFSSSASFLIIAA